MENSESRIAPSPEAASDDFASPSQPLPAEPPDRLAFEPVPLRYREDGLTPERQRAYVEALADCGIAREAAARVGLSEQAINRVRRRDDARSFDSACEAAHLFGARRLRSVAYERAIEGTLKGRYYRGELVAEERVYDNRLLTYLYGKVAHLLEPTRESRLVRDRWEEHMDALEQGVEPPDPRRPGEADRPEFSGYEVRGDEDGTWWTSFPPPAGFDGEEQGEFGDEDYKRTLSAREQAVLDSEYDRDDAEYRAREAARRDRFFGFAGDEVSSPMEAEPYETSEPSEAVEQDPDLGPIEYKSLFPPVTDRPSPLLYSRHPRELSRSTAPRAVEPRPGDVATCSRDPVGYLHRQAPASGQHWIPACAGMTEEVDGGAATPPRFKKRPPLRPPYIQTPPPRHPWR